ncbi:hypothetical protein EDB86DRAFT_2833150 [Lactarius hatsudake]|nr:hypothetical protein EDB86DRAFT_2833150 [Lactarius hatsudake]
MQNDSFSSSDHSSNSAHPENDREQPVKSGFSITPQDRDVLQEYLQEFQEADTDDWTRIVEKAMAKLYHLHPVNTPFDKKDASKETSGIEPGDPAFLGALQDATTTLWTELSPEVQEDYVKAAKEWSEETPPKDIQSRMASSMREQIIEDFQTYESEDNNLKIGFNDVSSVLEDGKDFQKYCPDWKSAVLWEQWIEFGKKCFAKDTVQEPPPKKDRSRTLNTPIPIVFDKDGCPELPKVTMFDGYKAKVVQSLLREYCIEHIRFVTGNKKQTIPWGVLVKDPSSWIFDDCIPKDFVWKDPSKIQIGEVFRLLYHWKERQDQGLGPLIISDTSNMLEHSNQMHLIKSPSTLAILGTPIQQSILPFMSLGSKVILGVTGIPGSDGILGSDGIPHSPLT